MNLKTVRDYAKTGVDFISVGALTHSATAVDLSMKIAARAIVLGRPSVPDTAIRSRCGRIRHRRDRIRRRPAPPRLHASTNDLALAAAQAGARTASGSPTEQTAGRGRGATAGTPPTEEPGPLHDRAHLAAIPMQSPRCASRSPPPSPSNPRSRPSPASQFATRSTSAGPTTCCSTGKRASAAASSSKPPPSPHRSSPVQPRHAPLRRHRHRHQLQPHRLPPELEAIATSLRRELPDPHPSPPPRAPRRCHPRRARRGSPPPCN
jgi:hypothetical protein